MWLKGRLFNLRTFHFLLMSKLGLEGEINTGFLVNGHRRTSKHSPIEHWPSLLNIHSSLCLSNKFQFKFLLAEGSRAPTVL